MGIINLYNINKKGVQTYVKSRSDFASDEQVSKAIDSVIAKHQTLELNDENFIIRPFKNYEEIIEEGEVLEHAVKFYASGRYAHGNDYLFTMRRKDEPDTPFITLEFDVNGNLLLAKKSRNVDAKEKEEVTFIKIFKDTVLRRFVNIEKGNRYLNTIEDFSIKIAQCATDDWETNHLSIYMRFKEKQTEISCFGFNGVNYSLRADCNPNFDYYIDELTNLLPKEYKEIYAELTNGILQSITVTNYGSTNNPNEFEYGGYHFLPERKFTTQEKDFFVISRKLASDAELGLCVKKYGVKSKFPYSHKCFYEASGNSKCDIFKCIENGNLYVPCENELFRFIQ